MANNCYNHIIVEGEAKDLKTLAKELKESTQDRENMVDFKKLLKLEKNQPLEDIGTRWLCIDIEEHEHSLIISGDSAWSPALKLFEKLSEKHPALFFQYDYEERGCDIAGRANIQNGETDHDQLTFHKYLAKYDYQQLLTELHENTLEEIVDEAESIETLKNNDFLELLNKDDKNDWIKEATALFLKKETQVA